MTTCQELEVLVTLRATGDLTPDEAKRLDLHLAVCPRCRAEADADAALLRGVALPPPSDAERRATATLAKDTLAALHRRERRAGAWRRLGVGVVAAAAVALAVLAPALLGRAGRGVHPPAGGVAVVDGTGAGAASSTWEPDLDDDASGSADGVTDATVASLDY